MDDSVVVSTSPEGARTIRLNRPESRNALSLELRGQLVPALLEAASASEVRCIVLRGDRLAFSAGGDVKVMDTDETPLGTVERLERLSNLIRTLHELPKPVIAAVEGPAVGAGFSLALACDVVVASGTASFGATFAQRGLVPDTGLTYLLARSVGLLRAKYLVLTARPVDAATAEAWGIVSAVWPESEFENELDALARGLASGPTAALGLSKRLLNRAFEVDFESTLVLESLGQAVAKTTDDHRASVAAFLERRPARFIGR
jgi:2-(1,2-epoxy-1,2-dihydrophenyl)acetyl-CoA isomerase